MYYPLPCLAFAAVLATTACHIGKEESQSPPPASESTAATPTTFYLVRHAEKEVGPEADPNNPSLTDVGRARAEQLVQVLTKVDLAAVCSPPSVRAINTVAPVASSKGLTVTEYNPELDLRLLADSLTQLHAGRAILMVGYSTTLPGILNALAHENRYPNLVDGDHDGLYRAMVLPKGDAIIDELRVPLCQ